MPKVNISLSWPEAAKIYLAVLQNGDEVGKAKAQKMILEMAVIAQRYADAHRDNRIVPDGVNWKTLPGRAKRKGGKK